MPRLHLYDKIAEEVVVRPHFCEPNHRTQLWLSDAVLAAIDRYQTDDLDAGNEYMNKVEYYAKAGFWNHDGTRTKSKRHPGIRPKKNYKYVLAIQPFGRFRICGFYEDAQRTVFVGVSAIMKKHGKKMKAPYKAACQCAADIRESGSWRKEGM